MEFSGSIFTGIMKMTVLVAAMAAHAVAAAATNCTATTQQGVVQGAWFAPYPSCSYKGIPFAQKPIGSLRFAKPVAHGPYATSPFNATEFGPGCMQMCAKRLQHPEFTCPQKVSEDCLYLNVYTPTTTTITKGTNNMNLSVLFWIHGGNFIVAAWTSTTVVAGPARSKS